MAIGADCILAVSGMSFSNHGPRKRFLFTCWCDCMPSFRRAGFVGDPLGGPRARWANLRRTRFLLRRRDQGLRLVDGVQQRDAGDRGARADFFCGAWRLALAEIGSAAGGAWEMTCSTQEIWRVKIAKRVCAGL